MRFKMTGSRGAPRPRAQRPGGHSTRNVGVAMSAVGSVCERGAATSWGRLGAMAMGLAVSGVLVGVSGTWSVPSAQAAGVCTSTGPTTTCTFSSTGEDSFTVPAGVSSVRVVATGARGGTGAFTDRPAGRGATVTADLSVSAGQVLYVEVGGVPTTAGCYSVRRRVRRRVQRRRLERVLRRWRGRRLGRAHRRAR